MLEVREGEGGGCDVGEGEGGGGGCNVREGEGGGGVGDVDSVGEGEGGPSIVRGRVPLEGG